MEKDVAYFSFYVYHEIVEPVFYFECRDREIIKAELLDERFKRIFGFMFDDYNYNEVYYFLRSRTRRDSKKGNLKEIYESILYNEGRHFNDTLTIEFTSFYLPEGDVGEW